MPKVSVIIPVYNVEKYIRKCLDSVINQTLQDIEIICVDDGSTDDCPTILDEYAARDARIKIIRKENGGLSSARNVGIKYVTSEYVGFVDSDDWIESETYETAYNLMCQYNVDVVCWGANIVAEDNDYTSKTVNNAKYYHKIKLEGLYDWNYTLYHDTTVTVWNKLYKTSIIKDKKIEFPLGLLHEDNEFIAKYLLYTKKVYYSNKYFYNYLQRNNSIMSKCVEENTRLVLPEIYKNIYLYSKKYNLQEANSKLLSVIFDQYLWHAYMLTTNKKLAIKKFKKLAKILDNNVLKNYNLELIQKNKINKISYIDYNTLSENIFSIKNKGIRKQVTLFGIKFKFKSKNLESRERLKRIEQKIDRLNNQLSKLEDNINV